MQYLKGEDIGRFIVSPTTKRWLRHDYASFVGEGESISVNHEWARKQPKILTRQTGDSIIAALDTECFYTGRSLHSTVVKDSDYSYRYLCAILNSGLITHIYRALSQEEGRAQAQVKLVNVRRLPIRSIAFTTPQTERKRLATEARELYERCLAGNDAGDALEFVEKQLREKRADVIHDLLAFLAERMMALNKDKQTAARQFLTDLKDFHGIEPRSLTPKTKLDEFWKLPVGEVFAHFRANKLRFKEGDDEKLRTRFQKAQDKLVPLDSQIEFTDRLIDQIVYRLYGLTPAEIKLVEKTSQR